MKFLLQVLAFAIVYSILFVNKWFGLNILILDILVITWLAISKQLKLHNFNLIFSMSGLLITGILSVLYYSVLAHVSHAIFAFYFIGSQALENARGPAMAILSSFVNAVRSQVEFVKSLFSFRIKGKRFSRWIWNLKFYLLPVLLIIIFIIIYRASNPVFNNLVKNINHWLYDNIFWILSSIDADAFWTFVGGLMIGAFVFFRKIIPDLQKQNEHYADNLTRNREKHFFRFLGLKTENKVGVFLFIILNIILLTINIIDINWVWFNFEWEGQYLKQFVHSGTYLLILSILISIVTVLYFFRKNQNFYSKNSILKILAYVWMGQNAILAVSVAIRNMYYITIFNLAFKRIAVFMFLLFTIVGLITVIIKITRRKTFFYLIKMNLYSLLAIVLLSNFVNWDIFIAKYNFNHSDTAFIHLDYLSDLSDKALPWLDKSEEELKRISQAQDSSFKFEYNYMWPETYHSHIQSRITMFYSKWERKTFLEWNYAEYRAYHMLK
ncbi:MAG: hypothetical protein C0592_05580 [Marinilabiliales bacterium]|nr:MAG: hypothetical protein C0592_05580 [Marinilabiliales bacterium]